MLKSSVDKGRLGELAVIKYLLPTMFILDHNFYVRGGEIDLVALDEANNDLVFAEVKSTSKSSTLDLEVLLTRNKLRKIYKSIYIWMQRHQVFENYNYRIDYIAQRVDYHTNKVISLKHYKNIGNF